MTRTQLPSGPRDPGRHPGGRIALSTSPSSTSPPSTSPPSTSPPSTAIRLLLTVGLLALTAASLGSSVAATFTGGVGADAAAAAGTVVLAPVGVDGPGNRLAVAVTDLAPGDTAQRAVTLRSDGTVSIDPSSVRLTVSSPDATPLVADPVHGLRLTVDRCPVPWIESGTGSTYTYTCAGTPTTALASRPVLGTDLPLVGLDGAAGAEQHLRVVLELPPAAPDGQQGLSGELVWSFAAAQRTPTTR